MSIPVYSKLSESQKQFVKSQLGSLARRYLVLVAGWLLARYGVDVMPFIKPLLTQTNEALGAVLIVAGVSLWSYRKHFNWNKKVDTALKAEPDTSRRQLEKEVAKEKAAA